MSRIFQYDGRQFPDPDPHLSVAQVRQALADYFPELTNADTREERRGEDTVYTFARRIGTKGTETSAHAPRRRRLPRPELSMLVRLRGVPEARLGVFALAAELITDEGDLDLDAAADRGPEMALAIAEAEAYARATRLAVAALRRLTFGHTGGEYARR